jgi:branched-chain amino acid transport system substrate-binding protein
MGALTPIGSARRPRSIASTISGIAVLATTALILAGCASTPSPTTAPTAAPGASTTPAAACGAGEDSSSVFALGSFLPLTGSLSFLAPPAVAGVGAALSDINAAGGVNGKPACIISQDSSDGDHKAVGDSNIKALIQAKPSAIVGPESSSVTHNILTVTQPTGTIVFSPAATDDTLAGEAHFFRNVAPNAAEGDALAKQILTDVPAAKVGVLVFNDAYGINLRDTLVSSVEAGGGSVVYGKAGQEFPSTETSFGTIVNNVLAAKPDVIAIIAFDQTKLILPALGSAGFAGKSTYFVDGNLSDYTSIAGVPDLTGAKGTQQGVDANKAFKDQLDAWYTANDGKGKGLGGIYNYGPESYDAVITLALAADLAKKFDSASIEPFILPVTGTTNGKPCTSYSACLALIKGGSTDIWYQGPSSIGPLNDKHNPSTAFVGIYEAVGKNTAAKFLTGVKATIK